MLSRGGLESGGWPRAWMLLRQSENGWECQQRKHLNEALDRTSSSITKPTYSSDARQHSEKLVVNLKSKLGCNVSLFGWWEPNKSNKWNPKIISCVCMKCWECHPMAVTSQTWEFAFSVIMRTAVLCTGRLQSRRLILRLHTLHSNICVINCHIILSCQEHSRTSIVALVILSRGVEGSQRSLAVVSINTCTT